MADEDQLVSEILSGARTKLRAFLARQPEERRLRLDGIEERVEALERRLEVGLFNEVFLWLSERAEAGAGTCRICGQPCQQEAGSARVRTKRHEIPVQAVRYRCRRCGANRCPIREWLGLESGMTTAGLDRALCAMSAALSFGETAKQMQEQHGHEVDRTLVERRTYAVGLDAVEYLDQRREARKQEVMDSVGERKGTERVYTQMDGGSVPVGTLERPKLADATELTPKRKLPKGKRPKSGREVRVSMAWKAGVVEGKVVDLHIAPHNHPEVSGERLYCAALEAGMGDQTHVHCTCDMAPWHVDQFEEQFSTQRSRSLCADFFHTVEYISDAGRALHAQEPEHRQWLAKQIARLREGDLGGIVADLKEHRCCDGGCVKTDRDECSVVAALRYLRNHAQHMDYPWFLAEELPIGSGEVEGRIRHIVRRRLDVPGDWKQANLVLLLALISIRQSGWWDEFFEWRDERDKARFRGRLRGEGLNRFRGTPRSRPPRQGTARERTGIDEAWTDIELPTIH